MLQSYNKGKDIIESNNNDLLVSDYIMKINNKYPRDIEDQLSLRCIIDIQYIATKKFYLFQLIFFVVTWVCPFFYQTFKDSVELYDIHTGEYKDQDKI